MQKHRAPVKRQLLSQIARMLPTKAIDNAATSVTPISKSIRCGLGRGAHVVDTKKVPDGVAADLPAPIAGRIRLCDREPQQCQQRVINFLALLLVDCERSS